jgi:hypothetical protein
MATKPLSALFPSHRKPLAACVISIFALAAPTVTIAKTVLVTSCADSGAGTLRDVINDTVGTVSGDTVDLSGLSCVNSTVSLTTGTIVIQQTSLTLNGPGAASLRIDGTNLPCPGYCDSRVLTHVGTGTLFVTGLTVANGYVRHYSVDGLGGGIFSAGNITLSNSVVTSNSTYSADYQATGGGIYAAGNVSLKYSTVSANSATSHNNARGGGIRAEGSFTAKYSTVDANTVSGKVLAFPDGNKYALGGGISAGTDISLVRSTVSNNHSNGSFAAIDGFSLAPSTSRLGLYSSTISGNSADRLVGGVYSNVATVNIYNTTIAFNTAGNFKNTNDPGGQFFAPGLTLSGQSVAVSAVLQSSLIANNVYGAGNEWDLSTPGTNLVSFNAAPANNLVRTDFSGHAPADTINTACPLLGPLRDNGGFTKTHALLSKSPGIDVGNNAIATGTAPVKNSFQWLEDQRGASDAAVVYPRISNSVADIGAYEIDQAEVIYNSSFDGCPELF